MAEESPDIFADDASEGESTPAPEKTEDESVVTTLEDSEDDSTESDDKSTTEEETKEPSEEERILSELEEAAKKSEDELEEIEDDEDPLINRIDLKALAKKYPNIHKDFPSIREMYFREKAFTKIYPTVEAAQESAQQLIALHQTVRKAVDGDPIGVLQDLSQINKDSVVKFVDNLLPQIGQAAPDLYKRAILPQIRQLAIAMAQQGQVSGNDNLVKAAQWVSQFALGDPNFPEVNFAQNQQRPDPEKAQLQQALQAERQKQATAFIESVQTDSHTLLKNIIAKELGPKSQNGLSEYMYKKVVSDCIEAYESMVSRDPQRNGSIREKWNEIIQRGNYDKNARTKILSAFLGRAREVIPVIARTKLAEAKGENVIAPKGKQAKPVTNKPGSKSVNISNINPSQIDYKKTTDQDLFEDRVYLKG